LNKRVFFCKQLAAWLFHAEWHYRTLLGTAIQCVDEIPEDCDTLINELLLQHPAKPSQIDIASFLQASRRLTQWFRRSHTPTIRRLNLESPSFKSQPEHRHPGIDTLADLADWLELSQSQLHWFANTWRTDSATPAYLQHYHYQLLEKRDGRPRLIEKPKPTLKRLQRKIYKEILSTLDTHPAVHGFRKGRNCLSHASLHVDKQYLFLFDISNCFQSIGMSTVKHQYKLLGYPPSVSACLAALCTHSVSQASLLRLFDPIQREHLKRRHLPQGAPTSPALVNATLYRLDLRLSGLADKLGLKYSRYADDIAMSGNTHRDWQFLEPLIGSICLEQGVKLNHKKSRIKRPHQKQNVTGIVVNRKTNIDRKYFDNLKAILTTCTRYGLDSQNRHGHPQFRAHLLGRIQYVKSLNEKRGVKLEGIYQDIK